MDPETEDDPTCDVVLKGGITSGVLYPTLLGELARRYRLVNVGGASAGAIAAVVAAAAEYGRQHGSLGFAVLEAMPKQLGAVNAAGDTALMTLFEPQPRTRPLMTVLRAVLRGRGWPQRWSPRWASSWGPPPDGGGCCCPRCRASWSWLPRWPGWCCRIRTDAGRRSHRSIHGAARPGAGRCGSRNHP